MLFPNRVFDAPVDPPPQEPAMHVINLILFVPEYSELMLLLRLSLIQ